MEQIEMSVDEWLQGDAAKEMIAQETEQWFSPLRRHLISKAKLLWEI
jgi:hypothetical protein